MPKRTREEPAAAVSSWTEVDDLAKVRHMSKVLGSHAAKFEDEAHLGSDLVEVRALIPTCAALTRFLWQALHFAMSNPAATAQKERLAKLLEIESRARALVSAGAVSQWYRDSDSQVKEVSRTVNGPLLAELAVEAGFENTACVNKFRCGARLVGPFGSGSAADTAEDGSSDTLSMRELVCNRSLRYSP